MEKFVQIRLVKCCKVVYLFWMVPERFSNFSSFTTQKKALVPKHCSKLSLKSPESNTAGAAIRYRQEGSNQSEISARN